MSEPPPNVSTMSTTIPAPVSIQQSFEDLGQPLHTVTFVVVDLETTGGSAQNDHITEFGAVKVRGGEVLGEFQTLVRPRSAIPAFITVLTGISNSMVATSPDIATVLPSFLDFAGDAVLVAHNARFDISFLKAAAAITGHPWPGHQVLDTVHLARQLVTRDESPNHKLSSLAKVFGATTTPNHRALADAQATVDVLHGLIARVGNLGIHTLEELTSYSARVTPAQKSKRFLAEAMPSAPGVYVFKDAKGRPLYVGTSSDLRRRTKNYFTASETRRRMADMVALAESITPIVCATQLEGQIRELRLIAEHQPPFNRRSRYPEKIWWAKLTKESYPRLSLVRKVKSDGATYAGPFPNRARGEQAIAGILEAVPLRQCTQTLRPDPAATSCVLDELGKCGAPCTGKQSSSEYATLVARAHQAIVGDGHHVFSQLEQRMADLSQQERFEDAISVRDRLTAAVRGTSRAQKIGPMAESAQLVAARRSALGGWEVSCIRYGRLAGSCQTPRGQDPMPHIQAMIATAEIVEPPNSPAPAAHPEETELILRWLDQPGVRIVELDGTWTCPVGGSESRQQNLASLARKNEDRVKVTK